jgi:hypothetical protein
MNPPEVPNLKVLYQKNISGEGTKGVLQMLLSAISSIIAFILFIPIFFILWGCYLCTTEGRAGKDLPSWRELFEEPPITTGTDNSGG